jgi:hypothetical protein
MDEQTKQALNDFIQKAITAADSTAQFAIEQAPLLVQEYLARAIFRGIFDVLLGVVLAALAVAAIRLSVTWGKDYETEGLAVISGVVGLVASIGSAVLFFGGLYDALSVYIAPRVYVMEQLRGLL